MTTVTSKSTKDIIWGEVEKLRAQIQQMKSAKLDPAADLKVKQDAETLKAADHEVSYSIDKLLLEINQTITKELTDAASIVESSRKSYEQIDQAIELKSQELADLFQVETELLDLAAIVNTKEELAAKYDEAHAVKVANAEAMLKELEEAYSTRRAEYNKNLDIQRTEDQAARKRENDEYNYSFDRKKKLENDIWQDLKATREKELDAAALAVEEATIALDKERKEIDGLKAKVEEIPAIVAAAAEKAAADAKKSAEAGYAIRDNYAKKDAANEKALVESKLEMSEKTAEDLRAQLAASNAKLDAAYIEIKDMAAKTVESAGNSRMIASLESLVKDSKNGNK